VASRTLLNQAKRLCQDTAGSVTNGVNEPKIMVLKSGYQVTLLPHPKAFTLGFGRSLTHYPAHIDEKFSASDSFTFTLLGVR
jgi:hypothetical protein